MCPGHWECIETRAPSFSFVYKSTLRTLHLLEMSIYKKKYLMQPGEFSSLCQMKFGQGTENRSVAHLEPSATCLCIWSFLLFLPKSKVLRLTVILSH